MGRDTGLERRRRLLTQVSCDTNKYDNALLTAMLSSTSAYLAGSGCLHIMARPPAGFRTKSGPSNLRKVACTFTRSDLEVDTDGQGEWRRCAGVSTTQPTQVPSFVKVSQS
ncbi:hypothetical protein CMUS01_01731 [Colletotrichum musicola]|uniref:Uncharacterized protein n=1 Tax=Colletotrichum musicola TaxID=2175873 RepID=A0A8H6NWC7_9PEZI|nr:hypothetical protein CMUS01_01731 [Colletotrichum musicola]